MPKTRIVYVNLFEAQGSARTDGPLEIRPTADNPDREVVGVINPSRETKIWKYPAMDTVDAVVAECVSIALADLDRIGEFDEVHFVGTHLGNDGCSGGAVMSFVVQFTLALVHAGHTDKIRSGLSGQFVSRGCALPSGPYC